MAYITVDQMIARFGRDELLELTDRDNEGILNKTIIEAAIADADAEIDGYIAIAVTLPLASVPANITRLAADIARYRLYDERATDQVTKRYDNALEFLEMVATGKATLGIEDDQNAASGSVEIEANSRVFTEDSLSSF